MKAVEAHGGYPHTMGINAGTENVNIANRHRLLDGDENNVFIGTSHCNVKIWCGFYRNHNAEFFMTLFQVLRHEWLFCGDEPDKEVSDSASSTS